MTEERMFVKGNGFYGDVVCIFLTSFVEAQVIV
jgi:hypothetical protein